MRYIFILLTLIYVSVNVFASEIGSAQVQNPAVSFQNIQYEDCSKMYNINKEKLFYLSIGAINSSKYKLEEIQTQNGYIIFSTGKNKYLLTIAGIDNENSILKITPCNNLYYFQPVIISDIFKYIESNKDTTL